MLLAAAFAASFGAAYYILCPFLLGRADSLKLAAILAAAAAVAAPRVVPKEFLAPRDEFRVPAAAPSPARLEYEKRVSKRLSRLVPFDPGTAETPAGWSAGSAMGQSVVLDLREGLVWGEMLPGTFAYDQSSFQSAQEACAALPPQGAWALPTMAEWLRSRKHGLHGVAPYDGKTNRWLAAVHVPDLGLVTMGLVVMEPSGNAGAGSSRVGARCVGRTAAGPEHGILTLSSEETLEALSGGRR